MAKASPEHRLAVSTSPWVTTYLPAIGNLPLHSQIASQRAKSRKEAMAAKCFDCTAGYADGRKDCEIPYCPIYPWMPYKKLTPDYTWASVPTAIVQHLSDEERQRRSEGAKLRFGNKATAKGDGG